MNGFSDPKSFRGFRGTGPNPEFGCHVFTNGNRSVAVVVDFSQLLRQLLHSLGKIGRD